MERLISPYEESWGGTLYKSTDARDRGNKLGSQYL